MTILVTGGAGFIGSHFIRYYLATHPDHKVVNLDALTYAGNLENLKDLESHSGYSFVKGDITDRDLVLDVVKEVDAIVHFAAESHVDRSIMDATPFVRTNVLGTQTLIDAALTHGNKRFHHVSTDEVFGDLGPHDPPFSESTPYDPSSAYSASKAASDHLVRAAHRTHGLNMTISNCTNNYGTYMFPEKMMPLFICNLMEGKKVPVYGDGAQIRDWIYVEDHCAGVDVVLQKGRIGETYCLGGGNQPTNLEVTKKILSIMGLGEERIEYVKDRPGHDRRYAMDFSKASSELGWSPQWDLDRGLEEMVRWYQENQQWVERCRSGAYQSYYEDQYVNRA